MFFLFSEDFHPRSCLIFTSYSSANHLDCCSQYIFIFEQLFLLEACAGLCARHFYLRARLLVSVSELMDSPVVRLHCLKNKVNGLCDVIILISFYFQTQGLTSRSHASNSTSKLKPKRITCSNQSKTFTFSLKFQLPFGKLFQFQLFLQTLYQIFFDGRTNSYSKKFDIFFEFIVFVSGDVCARGLKIQTIYGKFDILIILSCF